MKFPMPSKNAASYAFNHFELATFTIGAEAADTINVGVQLKDARGNNARGPVYVKMYLSDVSTGLGITATVTTSALAAGAKGTLLEITTSGKACIFVSDVNGALDLSLIQTAGKSYYCVIVLPNGKIAVSGIITFV